ncbi:MAG: molecular chaperone [Oceanospirillaceae bacterium]
MKYEFISKGCLLLCRLLLLLVSSQAVAMSVQPMIKEIAPNGAKSQYRIQIDNPSAKALTIELIPSRITMDINGKEQLLPADDDLLVIPVTAIVPPGKSQSVIAQYIGDPLISSSIAYQVTIKQVNVNLSGSSQSAIGIGVNFNTLLNVVPPAAQALLKVRSFKKAGKNWLLELENSGDRFARISKTHWTITDKSGAQIELSGQDISKKLDGNLVLPHSIRLFKMDPLHNLSPDNVKHINIQAES